LNLSLPIEIKTATPSDATALADLGHRTFFETFKDTNSASDMNLYLSQTFSPTKQLQEICDPNRKIAIAWSGESALGYFHLLKGETDASVKGPDPIELLRFYVDSRWHGKGIAKLLMDNCIELARENDFKTMWLGVWEKNTRAQAFYQKYGFVSVGAHPFILGTDKQTDIVMAREL
jgi:diamine N-acetyltransferase